MMVPSIKDSIIHYLLNVLNVEESDFDMWLKYYYYWQELRTSYHLGNTAKLANETFCVQYDISSSLNCSKLIHPTKKARSKNTFIYQQLLSLIHLTSKSNINKRINTYISIPYSKTSADVNLNLVL